MKIEEIKKEKSYRCTVYSLETGAISHEIVTGADLLNNMVFRNGEELSEYVCKSDIDTYDVIYSYAWIENLVVWGEDYIVEIEEESDK